MKRRLLAVLLVLCMILTVIPITVAAESPSTPTMSGRNIFANGTALIVNGTDDTHTTIYIDANRDGVLDVSEKSLSAAGITNAPTDGSDLSNRTLFGGAQSGTITDDSMITINGGSVASVYGGNGSYNDMSGGVTINMNGGSVARILACGYNNAVGGTGKTVSVTIHGGTVRGGVDQSINLESRNNASNTSLLIDGGMINGQISVKSTGTFIINGGNIFASIKSGSTCNTSPTNNNGATPVYKTALTLKENGTAKTNTVVSALTTDTGYTYAMTDVKTDTNGKLYVYLPQGKTVTAIMSGNTTYTGSITTTIDGTASGDFSRAVSTPPESTELTVVKTAQTQASVAFVLTTAPAGTYKVYADNNTATVHSTVTATLSDMLLTLTDSTMDITAGDYYITVTETGKAESSRLRLTVNNQPPCVHEGGTATYFEKAICVVCGQKYGTTTPDTTPPTGTISITDNHWNDFLDTVTFDLFFKDTKTVTVTSNDSESGVAKIEYLLSDSVFDTKTDVSGAWHDITTAKQFNLSQNSKQYIYVRMTDADDNSAIINSAGVVIFADSSVTPTTTVFDKNVDKQTDVDFTMALNGNVLHNIKNGNSALISGTDYTVKDNTVTVKKAYFANLANGDVTLTFSFYPMGVENNSTFSTVSVKVTVSDTTHYYSALLGDSDCDGTITIIDATNIQLKLAQIATQSFDEATSDTDEDGIVTIIDATNIQLYLANIPNSTRIGQIVIK